MLGDRFIPAVTTRTQAGAAKMGMTEFRNSLKALGVEGVDLIYDALGKKTNSEKLADIMTNPEWESKIKEVLEITEKEKLAAQTTKGAGKALIQRLQKRERQE